MDFQDNSIPTMVDPVRFFHSAFNGGFAFRYAPDGKPLEIHCDIVEYGLTVERPHRFHHPYPFFSRLFVFRKGFAELETQEGRRRLVPGRVYLLPSGKPFSVHYGERELFYFHLRIGDRSGNTIFREDDPVFEIDSPELARRLIDASERRNLLALESAMFTALAEWLPQLGDSLAERGGAATEFARIFAYCETHPLAAVGIGELAELYGIEADALSKRFRRKMKLPLKNWLLEQQLRRACELLLFSSMNHHEIARVLGFRETPYFYRFFHRYTGMTPRDFRRKGRGA